MFELGKHARLIHSAVPVGAAEAGTFPGELLSSPSLLESIQSSRAKLPLSKSLHAGHPCSMFVPGPQFALSCSYVGSPDILLRGRPRLGSCLGLHWGSTAPGAGVNMNLVHDASSGSFITLRGKNLPAEVQGSLRSI